MTARATRRGRDERGAVAVVVALAVTFVLIPVAALSLDLGSLYVREAALQQIADDAASAGAVELAEHQRKDVTEDVVPSEAMAAARAATVNALCAAASGSGDAWATACAGGTSWAGDGDPSNGEVSFYTGTPDGGHAFSPLQDAAGALTGTLVSGIRVVTPPSRVTFGLAGIFGTGHADTRRSATAGLFSVLPAAGFLPMFLRPGDKGGFCTRSAPKAVWQPVILSGACNPAVARGNLTAPRTDSTSDAQAMVRNAASGFDAAHLPLRGTIATLQLQNPTSSLVRELSPGLFGGTGSFGVRPRLKLGTCPGGYGTGSGPQSGLETAYLTSFLNGRIGDQYALRTAVREGTVPTRAQAGWLDASILRCGRLAVVPVLSGLPDLLPTSGLTIGNLAYPVAGLRLIWLDDRLWEGETNTERVSYGPCLERGFYWGNPSYPWVCADDLRAYTGYVLDPRLLPATVAGREAANALPGFIGSGLPVTVRLLRDVTDQPPG